MTTAGKIRTVLNALLLTLTTSMAQETRPVDVVVMLDTSGSMEDLLDATRARVWDVVNELGRMKPTPELRVGLVSFGTDKARAVGRRRRHAVEARGRVRRRDRAFSR